MAVETIPAPIVLPRSRSGRMAHIGMAIWTHRWLALAASVAIGVGGWQAARVLVGTAVVVDQVKRGALIETVVASGHVETPFRVEIGSQMTGTVENVPVQEGQRVTKGQPLISLASRTPLARRTLRATERMRAITPGLVRMRLASSPSVTSRT